MQRFLRIGRPRQLHTASPLFAGHSKWQNIKHRKARQDASRSTQNTKIANMIYMAAKDGGGTDPALNVRLATLMENAAKMSIPKKVIEGAIARASKAAGNPAENAVSISYEGVGPGGIALIVETLTENKNRTAQQVRAAFLKFQGALSPTAYLFQRRGWIELPGNLDFDEVFEQCAELDGIDDIVEEEDGDSKTITLFIDPSKLSSAANRVKELYKISDMGLGYFPDPEQQVEVSDEEIETRLVKLQNELDSLDDVNNIYHNAKL